jgi:hypothetical protein
MVLFMKICSEFLELFIVKTDRRTKGAISVRAPQEAETRLEDESKEQIQIHLHSPGSIPGSSGMDLLSPGTSKTFGNA